MLKAPHEAKRTEASCPPQMGLKEYSKHFHLLDFDQEWEELTRDGVLVQAGTDVIELVRRPLEVDVEYMDWSAMSDGELSVKYQSLQRRVKEAPEDTDAEVQLTGATAEMKRRFGKQE